MFLVVDIGNTTHKAAVFDAEGNLMALVRQPALGVGAVEPLFRRFPIRAAILSAVGDVEEDFVEWMEAHTRTFRFSSNLKLPLLLDYTTPETLGTDRIAGAAGALDLFPGRHSLVIQAGTCLVIDHVDDRHTFRGGSIAPGLRMRLRALHEHTAHLPLPEPKIPARFAGKSTQESILSGVILGMGCEINGFIRHYQEIHPDISVILTGGDAALLQNLIKNRIFAAPNLVLKGLYKILRCNVV